MFQQKSRVLVLALVVLSWAPLATAAETTETGFFDGLMQQLAVFLGLADETGPDLTPWGFTEAGPSFSPGGAQGPQNEAGPNWSPGGLTGTPVPTNEAGPDWSPGG